MREGNPKRSAALGESCIKWFSDAGSIPAASTKKGKGTPLGCPFPFWRRPAGGSPAEYCRFAAIFEVLAADILLAAHRIADPTFGYAEVGRVFCWRRKHRNQNIGTLHRFCAGTTYDTHSLGAKPGFASHFFTHIAIPQNLCYNGYRPINLFLRLEKRDALCFFVA